MVVGTKSDLTLSREISYDEGQSIAISIGAVYVETSSVNNVSIVCPAGTYN